MVLNFSRDAAVKLVSGAPIKAGEGITSIAPVAGSVTIENNNNAWSDIQIWFYPSWFDAHVQEYRAFVVKTGKAGEITIERLLEASTANYHNVGPGDYSYKFLLNDSLLDLDNEGIKLGENYRICLLSVSNNIDSFPHAFLLTQPFTIQNIELTDIYGNPIEQKQKYNAFIFSVPDEVNANVPSLSAASNIFALNVPNYIYAGQSTGKNLAFKEGKLVTATDTCFLDIENDGKNDLVISGLDVTDTNHRRFNIVVHPQENMFMVYPNPNSEGVLNIAIKNFGGEKDSFLDVFNSSGIKIKRIVVTEQLFQINLNGLPGGLYYVQLTTPEKQETQKIVVQ